ncbi:MAG: hypothetical protein IRY94_05415 [Rhodospirillaceae bacterium]|nr:hypothetical protein [Rhodospirillaceae bacterium]
MAPVVEFRIVELMASRLCHDLVSPVSAIGNGLELLEEGGGAAGDDALTLCMDSQRRAAVLLQTFRMAFGAGQASESLGDLRRLAGDFLHQGKVRLDWPAEHAAAQPPRGTARLLLNMVMLAAECLPRGGVLRVRCGGGAVEVAAEGQDPRGGGEIEAALKADCPADALTPRTVQAYFAARLAERLGTRLAVAAHAGGIRLRAAQPPPPG